MSPSSFMVRLAGVSKRFAKGKDTISIFDSLDLTIPQGDFVAVMGPSGSGKTTLLNLLGGIDRPDTGEIEVAGSLGGQFLGRWSRRRPGDPLLVRAVGLCLLLLAASLVASDQLNLRALVVALLVGGLLVVLGPVARSRQGRS